MRLSSDGLPFILPPALAAVALLAAGLRLPALAVAVLAVLVAAFFRDPDRHSEAPPGNVLSPADGRVVVAERLDDGRLRLAVFLSLFNVHVARSPVSGHLRECRRIPGPCRAAFRDDAVHNARVQLDIESDAGPVDLSLMAGLVARRVLPWVDAPDDLQRGQRIAIIRFGSRAELFLPSGLELAVETGTRVRAGETVIARPAHPSLRGA